MKKIALAGIINESCSFNPVRTTLQDFKDSYFKLGSAVAEVKPNERVIGGFIAATRGRDFEFEGIIATFAQSGGEMTAATLSELTDILVAGVKRSGELGAVFLNLMGANVAEGEPDTTGAMLAEVRKAVGKDCFIGVSLDHHGNVTQRMFREADLILGYDDQPHDFPASGAKAARIMMDLWDRKRKPHGALVKVPMMTPQDHFLTAGGPMKEWFDLAREIETDPDVIAASTCPTQPWLDVPEYGWSCLVYADTPEKAQTCATRLAQKAWDLRERFWQSERLSVADTVAAANSEPRGLVVISDTGDSVWGGSPGDGTALIAEMLKQGLSGPALVPIIDVDAFAEAVKAGTGSKISLQVGGRLSSEFSPPIQIVGVVAAVAEASEADFGNGLISKGKRTVLIECGQLKLAILEGRDNAINHPILYERLGIDVGKAQMVVLKTGSNFQYFKTYQSRLIRADSPGATQSDLTAFTWKHVPRPIYPLDEIKDWRR